MNLTDRHRQLLALVEKRFHENPEILSLVESAMHGAALVMALKSISDTLPPPALAALEVYEEASLESWVKFLRSAHKNNPQALREAIQGAKHEHP